MIPQTVEHPNTPTQASFSTLITRPVQRSSRTHTQWPHKQKHETLNTRQLSEFISTLQCSVLTKASAQVPNYSVYQTHMHTTSATYKFHTASVTQWEYWKLTPTGINEDRLPYTHSMRQTPATLWPRILLPHVSTWYTRYLPLFLGYTIFL